ncbi:MAG TPA: hypothetical protein VLX68_02680 [Chitinivibrionales bacterium]|nr:hypothetical protein [Chitinivibrionales bacterium]
MIIRALVLGFIIAINVFSNANDSLGGDTCPCIKKLILRKTLKPVHFATHDTVCCPSQIVNNINTCCDSLRPRNKELRERSKTPSVIEVLLAIIAFLGVLVGSIVQIIISKRNIKAQMIIAHKQINAQIVSSNRQIWINELRTLLSDFRDNIGRYHLNLLGIRMPGLQSLSDDQLYAIYSKCALLSFKIELMLSPDFDKNPENRIILEQIKVMMSMFGNERNISNKGSHDEVELEYSIHMYEKVAKKILKDAWEKIKHND